jgi:hypothetical protein
MKPMKDPLEFGVFLLFATLLASCQNQTERHTFVEERVAVQGFLTQMPIQVTKCQPSLDPIITQVEDPVVLFFVDDQEQYKISFKPKTDKTTNKPITPTDFYNSPTGKTFFWDPYNIPVDCNDTVTTSGKVTITGGCSIGYTITGKDCENDPVVQIIPDGAFTVSVQTK